MQFKQITDQAFRCVLYLCGCQRPRSIEMICKEATVPEQSVRKIMAKLRRSKIVNLIRGENSGYTLAKSPEKISPFDVAILFENTVNINRCLEEDKFCDRNGSQNDCPVRAYLDEMQTKINNHLKDISFLEIYEQSNEYKRKKNKPIRLGREME